MTQKQLSHTYEATATSFIDVAKDSSFPIQNLPLGIFAPKSDGNPRVGSIIGEYIIDLDELDSYGLFDEYPWARSKYFSESTLNRFLALGRTALKELRYGLFSLLHSDNPSLRENEKLRNRVFLHQDQVNLHLPVTIGDYTDFYSSKEHATNVGTMFRGKDNALQPNWLHLPVGYHGRASSVVISGQSIKRPYGQTKVDTEESPSYGPCKLLDFELEMGFFVGKETNLGQPIPIADAEQYISGMVIVNDWSARDIQKWEYVPLGPFLAKNFATSISPWLITMDALEPFRTNNPQQYPTPLPYLQDQRNHAYDIELEVQLLTPTLEAPFTITQSNFKYLYWSMIQQLSHHSVTGCNMRVGDLLASGTISGPTEDSYGSLLELTWRGSKPIELPNGEKRTFLKDGDTIIMKATCKGGAGYTIGFGEVRTTIQES